MPLKEKDNSQPLKVVIAAGGTAGHLVPALALADALTRSGARVSFIGTSRGLERELVPQAGYELDFANLRGLERRLSFRIFLFLWSLVAGAAGSVRIIRRRDPDVVVGGGGYVSAIPVFAGRLLRRPAVITELDSHMGLANRFLAPFTRRVCLSFRIPGREGGRYVVTGRALPRQLLNATPQAGREAFGLSDERPVVLVSGGSQGARSLNLACAQAFGRGPLAFQIVHVTGKRDFGLVQQKLQEQGADLQNYHLLDYTNDLPLAMAAADLVVGRSGASVLEVAALGKPALLVPYPYATADHQMKNARWMEEAGAAQVIPDSQISSRLFGERVQALLANPERLAGMARASAALGQRDGAGRIAAEIYAAAGRAPALPDA